MSITCGIDWAEAHHDVALSEGQGQIVARLRIDTGVQGFGELLQLLAEHSQEPTSVPIAVETDKNLLVVALQHAGFEVYAINPRAVARYRERYGQTGKKSDTGDAVLAGVSRTDRHLHRPLPQITNGTGSPRPWRDIPGALAVKSKPVALDVDLVGACSEGWAAGAGRWRGQAAACPWSCPEGSQGLTGQFS